MEPHGVKRKLTAILSADVKGYSRLMGEDEVTTVRTLTGHRQIMATLIVDHQGHVVDSPGDNLLAEFEGLGPVYHCPQVGLHLQGKSSEGFSPVGYITRKDTPPDPQHTF